MEAWNPLKGIVILRVFPYLEHQDHPGQLAMETELRNGLSKAAIVAIVCNSVVAVLILILFVILYKACKIPSCPERAPVLAGTQEPQRTEEKYLLSAAWTWNKWTLCGCL